MGPISETEFNLETTVCLEMAAVSENMYVSEGIAPSVGIADSESMPSSVRAACSTGSNPLQRDANLESNPISDGDYWAVWSKHVQNITAFERISRRSSNVKITYVSFESIECYG